MTCPIEAAGTIELYFYGELPAGERIAVQTHVSRCGECRRALEELTVIRAALASRPDVAMPPQGDWSAFMTRLAALQQPPELISAPPAGRITMRPGRRLVPYLALAALLALVTIGVAVILRQSDSGATAGRGAALESTSQANQTASPDAALLSLSGDHFQRSKLVVLGLATRDVTAPGADDWSYERDLATSLLSDTQLYRHAAEERGMNTLADVMRDLELVLLQASMSQEPDYASLEQLQRLIRRRDLLTKMNVVDAGARN